MTLSLPDARDGAIPERFRWLRELSAGRVATWAALELSREGKSELVAIERAFRGDASDDATLADWMRDARRMTLLEHPNVTRVREVIVRAREVLVLMEFVDGVRWSKLSSAAIRPPLEIALRTFVDVLTGLSALHNLRDSERRPLKLVHGGLTPEGIIVGADGVARLVGTPRPRTAPAPSSKSNDNGYLAPEVLLGDESADARSDVYSLGVLLWEALAGRRLFADSQPSTIVTSLLSGRIPRATVPPDAAWAEPLSEVAAQAMSAEPAKRFSSAASMAAELRRLSTSRMASVQRVSAFVETAFGDEVRRRREVLRSGSLAPVAARNEVSGVARQPGWEDESIDVDEFCRDTPDGPKLPSALGVTSTKSTLEVATPLMPVVPIAAMSPAPDTPGSSEEAPATSEGLRPWVSAAAMGMAAAAIFLSAAWLLSRHFSPGQTSGARKEISSVATTSMGTTRGPSPVVTPTGTAAPSASAAPTAITTPTTRSFAAPTTMIAPMPVGPRTPASPAPPSKPRAAPRTSYNPEGI